MTNIEEHFDNPTTSSWHGNQMGTIEFTVAKMTNKRTNKRGKDYFMVNAEGDDFHLISFPGRYWPPRFQVGDRIKAPVDISRYDSTQKFINICNYNDAPPLLEVVSSGGAAADGTYKGAVAKTGYVTKVKGVSDWRHGPQPGENPYHIAKDVECDVSGISELKILTSSMSVEKVDEDGDAYIDALSDQQLQFSEITIDGVKTGPVMVVDNITEWSKLTYKESLEFKASDLDFFNGGARIDITEGDKQYTILIDDKHFPFETSTVVNEIMRMYPEEFDHTVKLEGDFSKHITYSHNKKTRVWTTNEFFANTDNISVIGLDLPTVADGMKRVTDEFYKEQKYAAAVKALKEMRGFTTITRARKVFADIGLEITDDEYYREIEGRLMKEHKDYDRGYLDILLEEVDNRKDAEWGGNPETGEFIAIFPDEKLIVVEKPVANKATYFYRLHDGQDASDALARINLATTTGIKKHLIWSNKPFKDALKTWNNAEELLQQMVDDNVISSADEGLREWTGYFDRATHRSYENYEWKLQECLRKAPTLVMAAGGYTEPSSTRSNPIAHTVIGGVVSAITSTVIDAVAKTNPADVSNKAVKAYEEFHDQPVKSVVKAAIYDKPANCEVLGPLKHVIYFCSKWSEDDTGEVVHPENVDIHYIHEWNEEGGDTDAGPNCMYVAKSKDTDDYLILGRCDVLDVGITDGTASNGNANELLETYKVPEEIVWLGDCKEIAYIQDGKKVKVPFSDRNLCCDISRERLYIARE